MTRSKAMLKRIAMTIFLASAIWSGGCAATIASMDVDAALKVAADINVANARTAAKDKATVYDGVMAKLESAFETKLGASKGGAQAVQLLTAYRTKKAEIVKAKAADMGQYAKMLDNAALMVSLIDQRIALRARWDAVIGRVPAISQIRQLAEIEAREYMKELQGVTP